MIPENNYSPLSGRSRLIAREENVVDSLSIAVQRSSEKIHRTPTNGDDGRARNWISGNVWNRNTRGFDCT